MVRPKVLSMLYSSSSSSQKDCMVLLTVAQIDFVGGIASNVVGIMPPSNWDLFEA